MELAVTFIRIPLLRLIMQLAMYMYAEEGVKNILLFNELCSLFQLLVPYFSFVHTSSFRLVVQLAVYVSYIPRFPPKRSS